MRELPEKGLEVRRAANLLVSITPDIQKGDSWNSRLEMNNVYLKKKNLIPSQKILLMTLIHMVKISE